MTRREWEESESSHSIRFEGKEAASTYSKSLIDNNFQQRSQGVSTSPQLSLSLARCYNRLNSETMMIAVEEGTFWIHFTVASARPFVDCAMIAASLSRVTKRAYEAPAAAGIKLERKNQSFINPARLRPRHEPFVPCLTANLFMRCGCQKCILHAAYSRTSVLSSLRHSTYLIH